MDFVDTMRSHCSSAFFIDHTTSEAHDSLIVIMFRKALANEEWDSEEAAKYCKVSRNYIVLRAIKKKRA